MFSQIIESLKKLIPKEKMAFDPAILDDPIALRTAWSPLKHGGTNIRTHSLRIMDDGRHVFRPSPGFVVFCSLFMIVGLVIMVVFSTTFIGRMGVPFYPAIFLPVTMALVFAGVGGGFLAFTARPIVFDKATGKIWKGWREPREDFEHGAEIKGTLCPMDAVHALQIVSERVRSKNNSYLSYELNLVLTDGTRINVVDHGDAGQLRKDAALLGEYLEAAVWDSTR